jgi:hypothetical protein
VPAFAGGVVTSKTLTVVVKIQHLKELIIIAPAFRSGTKSELKLALATI